MTPDAIDYIEAHGTGTILGDPIEVNALNTVFGKTRTKDNPLWIGSVKTNIGHTEAAAGIASVIKVALSLQHQQIPPSLHVSTLINIFLGTKSPFRSLPRFWIGLHNNIQRRLESVPLD